ncbi:hypothetical protein HU200_033944 [Digitaria exilis]|uniref:Uncharacterized protein n=1 Tax=Digitaria exilis TaxID=1010633 RepID=A0A835BKF9_9POAL|nr:hypothetical protein HU200_033944 [Digitaria exilis]
MEKQQKKHARSMSFTGRGGGQLVSFLRSTVASFSSSFVPSRGKSSFNHRNAFSGPIVSIVPPEARGRRGSNNKQQQRSSGYRTPEPSSPKVSCIGQIKRSGSRRQRKVIPCGKNGGACPLPPRPPAAAAAADQGRLPAKGSSSLVKRMSFFRRSRSSRRSSSRSSASKDGGCAGGSCAWAPAARAPAGIGQMKRFASGRAAFQDFDWREEEARRSRDSDEEEEEEDEGFVAHSAPLTLGGGVVASEPRKEVNLWRRRPMAPPTPLQLP